MHPNLAHHLHSEECIGFIKAYDECSREVKLIDSTKIDDFKRPTHFLYLLIDFRIDTPAILAHVTTCRSKSKNAFKPKYGHFFLTQHWLQSSYLRFFACIFSFDLCFQLEKRRRIGAENVKNREIEHYKKQNPEFAEKLRVLEELKAQKAAEEAKNKK